MDYKKIFMKYLLIKVALIVLVCSSLLVHRVMFSFWYNSSESLEETQKKVLDEQQSEPIDVNEYNDDGLTALMMAANDGNLPLTKFLISGGADVHARAKRDILFLDTAGNTALHFAVTNGYVDVTQALLEAGSDPLALNIYKNTPMHMITIFANVDYQVLIFNLLMLYGANMNIQNNEGATPLHWLVDQGNVPVIQRAAQDYGDFINLSVKNNNGYSLLELAQPLEWYLDQAVPILPLIKDIKNTVLGLEIGQDVNARNAQGFAGVHLAAIQGNATYMKALIEKGANLAVTTPDDGSTPLALAARFGFVPLVDMLLQANAPVNSVNNRGVTIPMELLGVRFGRMAFIKKAIAQGALLNAVDNNGNTIVHRAIIGHDTAFVGQLLQAFGKELDVTIKNSAGLTPFELAQQKKYYDIAKLLQ